MGSPRCIAPRQKDRVAAGQAFFCRCLPTSPARTLALTLCRCRQPQPMWTAPPSPRFLGGHYWRGLASLKVLGALGPDGGSNAPGAPSMGGIRRLEPISARYLIAVTSGALDSILQQIAAASSSPGLIG